MYQKLLFFSFLLCITSICIAQPPGVLENEPQEKSRKFRKKSGKMTSESLAAADTGGANERKLSEEWDLEAIKEELESLSSELKGAKSGKDSDFNQVRVFEIKIEQKKKDLEKAKVIEAYKENRKDEIIEDGPSYLKEIHDFVNGAVFERYGNLKTKEN